MSLLVSFLTTPFTKGSRRRAPIPLGKAAAQLSQATDLQAWHLAEAIECKAVRDRIRRRLAIAAASNQKLAPRKRLGAGLRRRNRTSHRQFNQLGAFVNFDDPGVLGDIIRNGGKCSAKTVRDCWLATARTMFRWAMRRSMPARDSRDGAASAAILQSITGAEPQLRSTGPCCKGT
jgi:hypothetical protein